MNECFEKARKGRSLMPLANMGGFEVLHSADAKQPAQKAFISSPYRKSITRPSQSDTRPSSPAVSKPAPVASVAKPSAAPSISNSNSTNPKKTTSVPTLTQSTNFAKRSAGTPSPKTKSMSSTASKSTPTASNYVITKTSSLNSKTPVNRVRATPVATPTVVSPGNSLPSRVAVVHVSTQQIPQTVTLTPARTTSELLKGSKTVAPNAIIANISTRLSRPRTHIGHEVNSKVPVPANKALSGSSIEASRHIVMSKQEKLLTGRLSIGGVNKQKLATVSKTKAAEADKVSNAPRRVDSATENGAAEMKKSCITSPIGEEQPPHHRRMRNELRTKMTATEAIVIRNITKQNNMRRSGERRPHASERRRSVKSSQSEPALIMKTNAATNTEQQESHDLIFSVRMQDFC